jgi:hypothetical protein
LHRFYLCKTYQKDKYRYVGGVLNDNDDDNDSDDEIIENTGDFVMENDTDEDEL